MTTLRRFLEDSRRPQGTLRYHELQGFLFAVACAPERVQLSEWMSKVFAGSDPRYASVKECRMVMGELMGMFDSIHAATVKDGAALPDDCEFRPQPLANLETDAPIAQWSRGFLQGHTWVEESWEAHLPPQAFESFMPVLLTLFYFSSKEVMEEFRRRGNDKTVLTKTVVEIFPEAVGTYAYFGRTLQRVIADREAGSPHMWGTRAAALKSKYGALPS